MAHMLYVEVVLYPAGEVVSINPLQVIGIKVADDDPPKCSLLFAAGEWIVFGAYSLVKRVLSGEHDAIEQYDKKWTKPARKEGPRRLRVARPDPTAGGVLLGGEGEKK